MKQLLCIEKFLIDKDVRVVVLLFLIWKIVLSTVAFFSIYILPLRSNDLLGGGIEKYLTAPWFYGWANFDGEHYLSIAQIGYRDLEQAFFPVFPILMNILSKPFNGNIESFIVSGLIISNIAFLASLIILWKLIIFDYSKKVAYITILILILYPTSLYFSSLYSESLFLLLSVSSFYLMRKNKWIWASILGGFSSGTRVFGILLAPAFFIEALQKKVGLHKYFWILIIPFGLFAYMYYQWITTHDPLAFYHLQKIIGPQHTEGITLLPQIYFRYIKILISTDIQNPIYSTVVLEFFTGILFFVLPIYGFFKKMKNSYIFYSLVGFILPTIQGSFSSTPRYVLVLFPSFLALALFLNSLKLPIRLTILTLFGIWLIFETVLFFRGYWVA